MNFRTRLTVAGTAAVAVAVVVASVFGYLTVRGELLGQIDASLRARMSTIRNVGVELTPQGIKVIPQPELGGPGGYAQLVTSAGQAYSSGQITLPVTERAVSAARGQNGVFLSDMRVAGTHVRVITAPISGGFALQIARPLDELDRVLHRLRLALLLVVLGGVLLATGLGLAVSRAVLAPVERLTQAAVQVAETRDPRTRIDSGGHDELGTLAGSFNTMLEALDESLRAQRRLVSDASHELRTPLTSLRTNIEVLARAGALPPEDREKLQRDIVTQIDDLTYLVTDLVDLARGDEPEPAQEELRLDELVARAVEQARAHRPHVEFTTDLERAVIEGVPMRIHRAVSNLLDNAAKFSGEGGRVEVQVRGSEVIVRDHGPGIDAHDLPFVFDRFYRAATARALPGSGLGLAIVRQVAESHGGSVRAEAAGGGGTIVRLILSPTHPSSSPAEQATD